MKEGDLKTEWMRFVESKRGRRVLQGARVVFMLGIFAYLVYELRDVSWSEIGAALPTNPLFYLIFLLLYFLLPVAECFIYRITWTFEAWKSLPAFIKKRIYNNDVLGYSGEFYFYTWARKNVGLSDREILKTIRDQNVVSSAASTMIALVLVAVFLYIGQINITEWIGPQETSYLVGGAVVVVLLLVIAVPLRRYLFSMAAKTALLIFAIHLARLIVRQALQIGMWSVAMPEVLLPVWFTFAAASIIVSRIPLIPNRDLIFLGLGVSLAGVVGISEAGVFAMLGAITVTGKVINLMFFSALSVLGRGKTLRPAVEAPLGATERLPVPAPEEVG